MHSCIVYFRCDRRCKGLGLFECGIGGRLQYFDIVYVQRIALERSDAFVISKFSWLLSGLDISQASSMRAH